MGAMRCHRPWAMPCGAMSLTEQRAATGLPLGDVHGHVSSDGRVCRMLRDVGIGPAGLLLLIRVSVSRRSVVE